MTALFKEVKIVLGQFRLVQSSHSLKIELSCVCLKQYGLTYQLDCMKLLRK